MKLKKGILIMLTFMLVLTFLTFIGLERAAADERVVEDMVGRKVELPVKVSRIVTSYKTATQFIYALGAEDRLVAVDLGSPRQKLFTALMPEIKNLPMVGSKRKGLNLEAILAVEPDLVILYPYNDGPELAKKLEMLGIASLIIKPESLEEIRETNLLLGRVLNLEKKAVNIDQVYEKILLMTEKIRNKHSELRTVYFANSDLMDTVGSNMLQTALIELAGGENPAQGVKTGFVKSSPEQLIKWDPEIVIVSQFYRGQPEELLNDPRYQALRAVKNRAVYRFPAGIDPWDFPGPSSFLGIIWLAEKIYPGESGINLIQEVEQFYQLLYGKSFSELEGQLQ